jgi:hypothetical protein
MQVQMFKHAARWAVVAMYLAALSSASTAGSFTRGCAARDLQALMLIEERESAHAISAEKSSDALFAMMTARLVCHEGRVMDALAMYDEIVNGILTNSFVAERPFAGERLQGVP